MIGEDGGIQWGALLFLTTLHCHYELFVTTNVVVLYEYLSQEFPPWGTIKGYCIVLYCISVFSPQDSPQSALNCICSIKHHLNFSDKIQQRCN